MVFLWLYTFNRFYIYMSARLSTVVNPIMNPKITIGWCYKPSPKGSCLWHPVAHISPSIPCETMWNQLYPHWDPHPLGVVAGHATTPAVLVKPRLAKWGTCTSQWSLDVCSTCTYQVTQFISILGGIMILKILSHGLIIYSGQGGTEQHLHLPRTWMSLIPSRKPQDANGSNMSVTAPKCQKSYTCIMLYISIYIYVYIPKNQSSNYWTNTIHLDST